MEDGKPRRLLYEKTTRLAIGAFYDVYNELGGFPEFVLRRGLVVDPGVIVEVKTAPEILAANKAQLMHYLKATGLEVGLLFNFGRRPEFARVIWQKKVDTARADRPTNSV